jgi:DNA gyrase subunit A
LVGDAIPDARRGLTEVDGLTLDVLRRRGHAADGPFVVNATLVADPVFSVPPREVYERVVTLAQDFRTRYPLLCGEGTFGSIDDDPPADAPYTRVPFVESRRGRRRRWPVPESAV